MKQPHDLLAGGYSLLPRTVILDTRLEPIDVRLYALLAWYANAAADQQGEVAFPGQARLGRELGVSTRTVQRALDRLACHGYVEALQRGLQRSNLYVLVGFRKGTKKPPDMTRVSLQETTRVSHDPERGDPDRAPRPFRSRADRNLDVLARCLRRDGRNAHGAPHDRDA